MLGASASSLHTRIPIHPSKRRSFSLVALMNPLFHRRLWILALQIRRVSLTWGSCRFKMSRSPPSSLSPYLVEEGRSRGCGSRWLVAVGIALKPERFGLQCTYIIYFVSIITLVCHYRLTYSLDYVYLHPSYNTKFLCLAFTKTCCKNLAISSYISSKHEHKVNYSHNEY